MKLLAREDDEVDGGGIIEEVEVDSMSLLSRVDRRLLRKEELDALLDGLPKDEGVIEKYSGADEKDSELFFLGLFTGSFGFFLCGSRCSLLFLGIRNNFSQSPPIHFILTG